jgi:hypothetical protein
VCERDLANECRASDWAPKAIAKPRLLLLLTMILRGSVWTMSQEHMAEQQALGELQAVVVLTNVTFVWFLPKPKSNKESIREEIQSRRLNSKSNNSRTNALT